MSHWSHIGHLINCIHLLTIHSFDNMVDLVNRFIRNISRFYDFVRSQIDWFVMNIIRVGWLIWWLTDTRNRKQTMAVITFFGLVILFCFSIRLFTGYYRMTVSLSKSSTICTSASPFTCSFFIGNINLYLHFMSLLHIDMTHVLKILPQVRPGPTYST